MANAFQEVAEHPMTRPRESPVRLQQPASRDA